MKTAQFRFQPFSPKQLKVLTWWMPDAPYSKRDAIICDGAIRSGKTLLMSMSYVIWAMSTFTFTKFGMAGKTIGSLRRNVLFTLKIILKLRGYTVYDHKTENYLTISYKGVTNYFYLFGGRDERSQDLVQGFTAGGFFFDEVALMPQSFVNQATGRCSVEGSKFWFNCNPEGPFHWFKVEWIDKSIEKNVYRLHFELDDNPSLSKGIKDRYKRMYHGVFFDRFILGLWVLSSGIIYDMFDKHYNGFDDEDKVKFLRESNTTTRYISCDYGTTNPMVFLDIYDDGTKAWVVNEYYYDSKKKMRQKTDSEYADDLQNFINNGKPIRNFILDPSAASFKAECRYRGIQVKDADNSVLDGIRNTATCFGLGILMINTRHCKNTLNEMMSYIWDEKASLRGEEKPVKEFDHAPDALRYFVKTVIKAWRLNATDKLEQSA